MMLTSVNGPNANWKFIEPLKRYWSDNEQHQLIDIGLSGLHIIHRAFKTGAESSNWELKKVLKGEFNLLHEWPAKRDDCDSLAISNTFPLFFCGTSWIHDIKVADWLINVQENVAKARRFWENIHKSNQPSCKSFLHIQLQQMIDFLSEVSILWFCCQLFWTILDFALDWLACAPIHIWRSNWFG